MCKAETMPDTYLGALRNIWFDERSLFNNNFPFLDHGNGINIYESVTKVAVFCCIGYFSIWGLIDRKLQGLFVLVVLFLVLVCKCA